MCACSCLHRQVLPFDRLLSCTVRLLLVALLPSHDGVNCHGANLQIVLLLFDTSFSNVRKTLLLYGTRDGLQRHLGTRDGLQRHGIVNVHKAKARYKRAFALWSRCYARPGFLTLENVRLWGTLPEEPCASL